jgi:arylsulfatase A-like enzyme
MNAICLVFDRLHAGYLGAYGNTWIETPAVDRLASQSFIFDQVLIDTPDLNRLYRSYWQGRHAIAPDFAPGDCPSLPGCLRELGVTTALLTDDPLVARHPLAVDFDEIIDIDPPWECRGVEQIEQTHLAQCFVQIIDYLESAREPFMLWCHLAGLGTTWDAPLSFRRAYKDEDDPDPPIGAEVPEQTLAEDHDPDELLGIVHSYAGQVSLLDSCLEAFLEFLKDLKAADQPLLALTSSRGFPLGEHRRVGPCDEALYGELVQVPLLLRFPDGTGAAARSQALVEPADLWAMFSQWWQNPTAPASPAAASLISVVRQDIAALRDRLCITGPGDQRAIRTPAWYLRAAGEGELYVKPDDRWEVNNVSNRCMEVVASLQQALLQCEGAIRSGTVADLPPLSDVLIHGLG